MSKAIKIIMAGVFVFAFLASPAASFAFSINYPAIPAPVPGGSFDLNCIDVDWNDFSGCYSAYTLTPTVANIILFLFVGAIWVGGIIALVSLIYTGIEFIISGEDSKKRAAAKDRLAKVLWGLAILLISVVALNFINPDITRLEDPYLLAVETGTITQPGIPSASEEKTGVFSCGWDEEKDKCIVAEESCADGYIVDTEWCDNVRHSECVDSEISKDVPCIDPAPECSDGIDNDGDGFIDYPVDGGCVSPEDDDETDESILGCYEACRKAGGPHLLCEFECVFTSSCDPVFEGYAVCLKREFNVVVTGTSNSSFMKNIWDGMYNATADGGLGYRTKLKYGGNVLEMKYAPTSSSTSICNGFASGANTLLFKDPGCLTLPGSSMRYLIQHETGHIITSRNPTLVSRFAAALPTLVSADPTCYQYNITTCGGLGLRQGHFIKTYAIRYICAGVCYSGISHVNESFAEGMANYLYANRGGGFACSQNISSIPTQCSGTNAWMRTNVYNP